MNKSIKKNRKLELVNEPRVLSKYMFPTNIRRRGRERKGVKEEEIEELEISERKKSKKEREAGFEGTGDWE